MYNKTTELNISTKGFSLIEVLVSLALFSIVVTMSVGTLVVLMDANAKAQETRELVNQVSMVLDGMTREIRTGFDYRCSSSLGLGSDGTTPVDCPNGYHMFGFTESGTGLTDGLGSHRIGYRLNGGAIQRSLGGEGWEDITPTNNMEITRLWFTLDNSTQLSDGDNRAPIVTIIIQGEITTSIFADPEKFILQTTVAQQSLDI